jgi:hypothetical protein
MPAKRIKLGLSGAAVGKIGEPLYFRRHVGQPVKLGRSMLG